MNILQKYIQQFNFEESLMLLISKGIKLLILLIIFLLSKKIINFLFKHTVGRSLSWTIQTSARKKTIEHLLHNCMHYILYFFLVYWLLSILGVPVSSLLAGAGLAGVALGLGAQGFLSDVVNGFFILLEDQFEVGDSVEVGAITGLVSTMGIRTTQIRGFDGTLHFIPNRNITIVSNKSRGDMRAQIDIPVYTSTDINKVTSIIQQVNKDNIENYPEIIGSPNIIGLTSKPSGQLVFRVDIFTKNGQQVHIYAEFLKLYYEALNKEKVDLPRITGNTIEVK
ncbi:mechanosensitive ion channel family protein [Streptococcus thermophilus]|uniref:mechanosensitive ion channel family protein n=1 Tax=Streptococcus thermophilus TaxID=1308 RepID=UPI001CF00631|nr:mechanosensitive ion channel family protein [Streptococcus thermophilus]MCA6639542.1 mechanosensitive ion channel family protein [Streptococcus thermophilus]MCA6642638.1 mechanosensitive ion channel family protein [Streptococcus thermophilus]MCA6646031.1 mechanosensitive ion channel family protein [Streptococcus thermophilus]